MSLLSLPLDQGSRQTQLIFSSCLFSFFLFVWYLIRQIIWRERKGHKEIKTQGWIKYRLWRDVGDISGVGDVGDVGNVGDVGYVVHVDNVGDVGNVGDVDNVGDLCNVGDVGNLGNVGNVDDISKQCPTSLG